MVPEAGIEPARAKGPRDFKSLASAYSATPALTLMKVLYVCILYYSTAMLVQQRQFRQLSSACDNVTL